MLGRFRNFLPRNKTRNIFAKIEELHRLPVFETGHQGRRAILHFDSRAIKRKVSLIGTPFRFGNGKGPGLLFFGLISFSTEQRTREVGIRKSMGATSGQIVRLFSRETLVLLLIANVIAWPITYLSMDRWLQDFAYRTSVNYGYFVLVLVLTILMAFLTMSYQTIRSARKNPVLSLKYE